MEGVVLEDEKCKSQNEKWKDPPLADFLFLAEPSR
jgi:hypothetical protein